MASTCGLLSCSLNVLRDLTTPGEAVAPAAFDAVSDPFPGAQGLDLGRLAGEVGKAVLLRYCLSTGSKWLSAAHLA